MDFAKLSENDDDREEMENGTTIDLGELEDAIEAVADQYFGELVLKPVSNTFIEWEAKLSLRFKGIGSKSDSSNKK